MTGNTRKQVRGAFLAFLMVMSVFGMTVGFAGSGAAVSQAELSDNVVQPGETFTVSGDNETGDTIYIVADNNTNGEYNDSTDTYYAVPSEDVGADEFETSLTAGDFNTALEDGDEVDIYAYESASTPSNGDALDAKAGSLTVDGTAPDVEFDSPSEGEVVNQKTEPIEATVTDGMSANDSLSILVNVENNGESNTYQIDPETDTADGVDYDSATGTLTISPKGEDVPEFDQGSVNATVDVTDEAGNTQTGTLNFTVDLAGVEIIVDSGTEIEDAGNHEDVTNDINQTFTVTLDTESNADLNHSESELTITGPDGYEVTLTNDNTSYTNNGAQSGQFDVDPSGDEVPSFEPDGEYTVVVTSENEAGTPAENGTAFYVDTESPNVTSVELGENFGDGVNSDDVQNQDLNVSVTFDEEPDPKTFQGEIDIGGVTETFNWDNYSDHYVEDDELVVVFEVSGELSNYGQIDDSGEVNVTTTEDWGGNSLANAGSTDSNASFDVDTAPPTVTVNDLDAATPGTATSGYVNVSDVIDLGDDVEDHVVYIRAGQGQDAYVDVTKDAENLTTQNLPDGDHELVVYAVDENDNLNDDAQAFTLDNDKDVVISQQYLDAWAATQNDVARPHTVADDAASFTPDEVFSSYPAETQFYVNGEEVDRFAEIDPSEFRGDSITVTAESDDESESVVIAAKLQNGLESNDDGQINIGITGDDDLETLDVTVKTADNHIHQDTIELTREDFEKMQFDGETTYSASVDAPRDGAYSVYITDADGSATLSEHSVEVSSSAPELTGAELEAGYANPDQKDTPVFEVNMTFDQPADITGASFDLERDGEVIASASGISTDRSDEGIVTVQFDEEPQTSDAVLNATGVTSLYKAGGAGAASPYDTELMATISLDLEEGFNVVSVPAETGQVELDGSEFDSQHVEAVWSYDASDESWNSYVPGASENDLTALEGGEGYIVVTDAATTVDVNAQNVPLEDRQAIQQQRVNAGWNLIGHYQEAAQTNDQAFTALGDRTYSVQLGYTGMQVDELDAGEGYWLFVDESGYHVPVDYDGMSSEQPEVYNVQAYDSGQDDDTVSSSETLELSAEVDHDERIDHVIADSPVLQNSVTLTYSSELGAYNASVDSSNLNDGADAEIAVTAIDAYGNADASSDTVSVETTSPTIQNPSPSDGTNTTDNQQTYTVDISDSGMGVDESTITVTVSDSTTTLLNAVGTSDSAVSYSSGTLTIDPSAGSFTYADGQVDVTVNADDNVGNSAPEFSSNFTVDTTEPTVSSVQISDETDSNGEVTSGDSMLITADVSDDTTNVDTVTADASAFDAGNVALVDDGSSGDATADDGTYSLQFTVGSSPTEGDQTVTVNATDTLGNGGSQAIESAALTVDTTAPSEGTVEATSGDTVQVPYDEEVVLNASDTTSGFTVTVDGTERTIASASVTSSTIVELTLDATYIDSDSTVDVEYVNTSENVQDTAGNIAGDFSKIGVTNSAPDTAQFSSAATSGSSSVDVTFDEAVAASDSTGFTVRINDNEVALDSSISGSTTTTLTLTLSSATIQSSDEVTVSYDGSGDVTDDDGGNPVIVFDNETVTNNI